MTFEKFLECRKAGISDKSARCLRSPFLRPEESRFPRSKAL